MALMMLAVIFAVGGILLLIYSFFTASAEEKDTKGPKTKPQQELIAQLEEQNRTLKSELEKRNTEYQGLQNEIEPFKKRETELNQEVARLKEWVEKEKLETEKAKKENSAIKEQLVNKGDELAKEFSLNLDLNKQLKDKAGQLESLEKANRELNDNLRTLQAQVAGYNKEIERLNTTIAEFQKKEGESGWVSKAEHDELKQKAETLAALEAENKDLRNKMLGLQAQITDSNKEIERQKNLIEELQSRPQVQEAAAPAASQQEYAKLKEKLATAEEVLRLLHGGG